MTNDRDTDIGERLRRSSRVVSPPDEFDHFERLQRRRSRKQRNERLLAGGVSVLLVGALVAGSLTVLRSAHSGHGAPAAGGAGGGGRGGLTGRGVGSPMDLQPGQYLYQKQTLTYHGETFSTETWWATDGSGRMIITCSNQDCQTDSGPGYASFYGSPGDHTYGPGKFPTDSDLTDLSTDPATLQGQLIERTSPGGHSPEPEFSPGPELTPGVTVGSLLDAIMNIVNDPNAQPGLVAAVFRVTSTVDGVVVHTNQSDPAGRGATILVVPGIDGGHATNWYFDPTTSLFMGYGPTDGSREYTFDQGIVDSTDTTPSGDQWLYPPAT
jgi:hypothetical protein